MLTIEDRLNARQFNTRARQLFWNNIVPKSCPVWNMDEESIVDWVLDFQSENHLLMDGMLGPSSLITMLANTLGGVGGLIIDGNEVQLKDVHVARMFIPEHHPKDRVSPDLCCFLSIQEIDSVCRDRIQGKQAIRSHFSIDSSKGQNQRSLIIQWSDPMRAVPFTPTAESIDYPSHRQCIGIEFETALLLYQLDFDERRWNRRRPVIKANIGEKLVIQPVIYEPQIQACISLMQVLYEHLHIPVRFPIKQGKWNTSPLEAEDLRDFSGYLTKFHYHNVNNEPGAGLVAWLDKLFESSKPEPIPDNPIQAMEVNLDSATPKTPIKDFTSQLDELSSSPQPTSSFSPHLDDSPRFSLSKAIESAHISTRAARAARIAQRSSK